MSETQWPRFQVFHQEREGRPHVNAGTVHAPDAEMALQNARDVFVRRPECTSLWVAPANAITSVTAEELEAGAPHEKGGEDERAYEIFVKLKHARPHEHVGQVMASDPQSALRQAIEAHPGLVWFAVEENRITRSTPEEIESWFAPAEAKPYRDQSDYPTLTLMRRLRDRSGERT